MGRNQDDKRAPGTLEVLFTVMRDETLLPELKTLWVVYRSYENPTKGRGAWPGDELLASHIGKSPRAVQRYRAELLRRGFLKQELRGPHPAIYRAVIPGPGEDPGPESFATHGETRDSHSEATPKASPEDSPKASPPVSPPVSPYYGEGGENGENVLFPNSGKQADRPECDLAVRDDFILAMRSRDAKQLLRAVDGLLYRFGEKAAESVVSLPDYLLDSLENAGHEAAADAVGAMGAEEEVVADALRDMCRKKYVKKWSPEVFASFVVAAAGKKTGGYS